MSKTLVIAEKPSVGGDLARVLKGPFKKQEGFLEGPDHVVTWAVGHLVQLADPDEYDPKFKTWRMGDLPIVPDKFKLVVRDERSRKQMSVVAKQLGREDVNGVVNACDAGREGELIFAYLYEKAKAKKPVQRLWLNSMTNAAMKEAFKELRPAAEFAKLEQAARSRSEADWIVGMNATRAATIRLRSSFDGAVSLGRVQTPTLAIVARREEEIKAFKPEPYWLVDAKFAAGAGGLSNGERDGDGGAGSGSGDERDEQEEREGERIYRGRFHAGAKPRIATEQEALAIVEACEGKTATITKLEKKEQREKAPMLYDLTTLQREANTRYGFSAKRTLAAAQRCYEEHKALTYPRTSSRYLTKDMVAEIKPTAELVGARREYSQAARYVTGLDVLPLGRVVNDAKVTDHHAIIPTRSEHDLDRMGSDDKRIYDMVARRFLAVFHPEAVFENTRVESTVPAGESERDGGYVFRTHGKLLLVPGWRGVYDEMSAASAARTSAKAEGEEDEGADQQLPRLEQGERVQTREIKSARKETKPPRRYSDASLLGAMETAGQLVDDDELREAMKDSGIGTPATRAAIIERLIAVGYIERDGRSLVASEKGLNVIRLLNEHALTSPGLTGDWENRLGKIERGEDSREKFMADIAGFAKETISELDEKLKDVRIPRASLGPCPVCGHEIRENRKGYSCWAREDPGCGFVIWKRKAGKQLPVEVARELIKTGYSSRQITGFKGRSGRGFKARLALEQTEDGKWRVEFNEPWAKEGAKPPDAETDAQAAETPAAERADSDVEARTAA
ncbi:MAG TPA: DNA topoisomerase 3 [Solirubrobacteraceae bacterium]|jgi:DNA topoisomerase-3|nr:DNA topoisomerase 3 [Solirubrobacteraceae bacterium]